jgi:hypothetical protein
MQCPDAQRPPRLQPALRRAAARINPERPVMTDANGEAPTVQGGDPFERFRPIPPPIKAALLSRPGSDRAAAGTGAAGVFHVSTATLRRVIAGPPQGGVTRQSICFGKDGGHDER